MLTILLVVVVLMLIGAMPTWRHSRGWGYYPSGGLGLVLLILVVLLLSGHRIRAGMFALFRQASGTISRQAGGR
jgi:Protein of unknown function (DUF3309)